MFDQTVAAAYDIQENDVVVSIHCGSRDLGHQIGTEFLIEMAIAAKSYDIQLPNRELACAPINSEIGQRYLGAMRAAINCALANRQILTQLTRDAFSGVFPKSEMPLLYDVSHNTCKVEEAPGAYKDVSKVVDAADHAGLASKVARLEPLVCVKG